MSHKQMPKKLEDDLNNVKYYKAGSQGSSKSSGENLSMIFDDSHERAMVDELFGDMGRRHSGDSILPKLTVSKANSGAIAKAPLTTDFTTSLLQRLRVVEAEAAEFRQLLSEQIVQNEKLDQELSLLKQMTTVDPSAQVSSVENLQRENKSLKSQIAEMEAFLADYGLVWVGASNSNQQEENEGEDGVDFMEFAKAVVELNKLIYAEPTKVVVTDGNNRRGRLVHSFEAVQKVKLTFYKNGLLVNRGPFRPQSSPSFQTFTRDILDGYFPSEFSADYPEGVIFDLIDHRNEDFSDDNLPTISTQQLLGGMKGRKIGEGGEIHDLKSDLAKRLQPSDGNAALEKRENKVAEGATGGKVAQIIPTRSSNNNMISSSTPLATIQLRWREGGIYLLKATPDTPIGELKKDILDFFSNNLRFPPDTPIEALELRAVHPPRLLSNDMSIDQAELMPNGTIHGRLLHL